MGSYAACLAILAASTLVGAAVSILARSRRVTGLEPAVGLGILIAVVAAAARLPGRATTGAVVCAVVVLAAIAVLVLLQGRTRTDVTTGRGPWPALILTAGLALAMASIPFLANGRVGLPGVSFNNDLAIHLGWVEAIRDAAAQKVLGLPPGYPLGPHALVAVTMSVLGIRADEAFTGLLLAVPVLAAVAAAGTLRDVGRWRSVPAALVVGLPYLVAAYGAEGAFKETIQALFVLAFALALRNFALGRTGRWDGPVTLAVLAAATIYNYSYAGLAWPAGAVVIWLALELVARIAFGDRRAGMGWLRGLLRPALIVLGIGLIAVLPELPRVARLFVDVGGSAAGSGDIAETNLGNLAGALPVLEGFGIWMQDDFRFVPPNALAAGVLGALALGATVYGTLWSLTRRDFALPAALAAATLALVRLRGAESPYLAAKALVILGPLAMMVSLRGLLEPRHWPTGFRDVAATRLAAAALLIALALFSSFRVLRGSQVGPRAHADQLAALRPLLGHQPTAFLGNDDFAGWELAGVPVANPTLGTADRGLFAFRPGKVWDYGQGLDFDSVAPASLDRFRFAITTNGPFQSTPPPNFERVTATSSYVLWKRVAATPRDAVLSETNASGAVLNCRTPAGRRVSRLDGTATVLPKPVYGPVIPALGPGATTRVAVRLPPGRWDLSVSYVSPQAVDFSGGGMRSTLPANLDRPGPWWRVGQVHSAGAGRPTTLTVGLEDPGLLDSRMHVASFSAIVATRPAAPRTVPLRQACGRWVDHYERSRG